MQEDKLNYKYLEYITDMFRYIVNKTDSTKVGITLTAFAEGSDQTAFFMTLNHHPSSCKVILL